MVNQLHNTLLLHDKEGWQQWRQQSPLEIPDLSGADLSGYDLAGVDLHAANLNGARLIATNLRQADLSEVDLSMSLLIDADLAVQRE